MNTLSTLKSTTLAIALAFGLTSMQAIALDSDAVADSVQNERFTLETEFKRLDTDSNASLNQAEFSNDKFFTKGHFVKADVNNDGSLDQEEFVNYKSGAQKVAVKRVASDSVITSKAKAGLLAEKDLKSLQISVKTFNGAVILSGFVDDELSRVKAETIVQKIDGVKSVKNSLVVKG
ncbi:MAG: BON domain-containing protein [Pseudomonadota bacterium]